MLLFALLAAPLAMAAATVAERHAGPSMAGCLMAIPITLPIGVIAVGAQYGNAAAATLALTAGGHVVAQVAFAVGAAHTLRNHRVLAGVLAGAGSYVATSIVLAPLPPLAALALAAAALHLGSRALPAHPGTPSSSVKPHTTAIRMAAASAFVAALMLTMGAAGPHAAGIVSAFPVMTATLALTISHTARRQAASHAIGGMLSGLRAYLAFCLAVIPVTALAGALAATAAGLLACAATCRITMRAIRSSPTTATAG